jgi:hypothetical protein
VAAMGRVEASSEEGYATAAGCGLVGGRCHESILVDRE